MIATEFRKLNDFVGFYAGVKVFGALIFVSDVLVISLVGTGMCFYNSLSSFLSRGSCSSRFFGFV